MQVVQVPYLVRGLRPTCPGDLNQNLKQKQYCDTLNKEFKNGPHTHTHAHKVFKKKSKDDLSSVTVALSICCLIVHIWAQYWMKPLSVSEGTQGRGVGGEGMSGQKN